MTKAEAVKMVLDLARSEIGYHEKASKSQLDDKTANSGGANWTKYAAYIDGHAGFYNGIKNGYAWCDVFVDYLFVKCFGFDLGRKMLCQPLNSAGAGCLFSAQYYKQAGRWSTNGPQAGDQIFFSYSPGEYSHTGIVEQVNGDTVTTIEGNTSDQVGRRNYNIGNSTIAGYGRPNWNLVADVPYEDEPQQTPAPGPEPKPEPEKPSAPTENHSWDPPLLKYDPDNYFAAVCVLQGLLNCHNFDSGKIDGYYGPKTVAAVNKACRFYGLDATGDCRKDLWKALGLTV